MKETLEEILSTWNIFERKDKEKTLLVTAAKDLRADELFTIAKSLYLTSAGRKFDEKVTNGLIGLLTGMYLSVYLDLSTISKKITEELAALLSEDQQLHTLQRFFPENHYSLVEVLKMTETLGLHGGLMRAVLAIAGREDADLIEFLAQIGYTLDASILMREYNLTFAFFKERKYAQCSYYGVAGLRDLVDKYVVLTTFTSLPQVTEDNYKDMASKVAGYVAQFDIEREVQRIHEHQVVHLGTLLHDVEDIFVDYPQGKVRVEALKQFLKKVLEYYSN